MFLTSRSCVSCPDEPPQCPGPCNDNETCAITAQVCAVCPKIQCFPKSDASSKPPTTSKAALAGAVVAVLLLLAASLALVVYFQRRRKSRKSAQEKALEPPPEIPASAADVLSREDPHEKPQPPSANTTPNPSSNTRLYHASSLTTINLDPSSHPHSAINRTDAQGSLRNPFGDQSTLASQRSEDSHQSQVPIALVPYGSVPTPTPTSPNMPSSPVSATPSRPARSPDVSLRLEGSSTPFDLSHVNVSDDDSFAKPGVPASVRSNMTGASRASCLTTGTYATDLFNPESSTVVMRQQGKIIGLSKAQVVAVPSSSANSPVASSHLMPTNHRLSRLTLGKSPLAQSSFTPDDIVDEQIVSSPFADKHALSPPSPSYGAPSTRTTASNSAGWNDADSIASGIEASISSAKRVIIRSDGRLTAPSIDSHSQYSSSKSTRRVSYASEASSRADSILEAFPFVPPSLPPSPMSIHTFRSAQTGLQRSPQPRSSPLAAQVMEDDGEELVPPGRSVQPVSVYSARSAASSGLGDYPVQLQIGHPGPTMDRSALPSRASLDTLALSRDLSAYPLAFDEARTPTHDRFKEPRTDH